MNVLAELVALADRAGEDELRDALTADLARAKFSDFVYRAWPVLHEDQSEEALIWRWYLDCMCEHAQAQFLGQIEWLLIAIPPGFAKSIIFSVLLPSWVWLHKPWHRFLCSGTNERLTLRDARRMKAVVESRWYRRTFLPDWRMDPAHAADTDFANSRMGQRLSATVQSGVQGQRMHWRILDDGNDPEKLKQEEFRRVNHWLENTFLKRGVPPRSPLLSIQQRLSQMDATAFLLDRMPTNSVYLWFPNRFDPRRTFTTQIIDPRTGEAWMDARTEEDELLNEQILDRETTDREREKAPAMDAAQNQQDPTPDGGIVFRPEMFMRWSHEPNQDQAADWEATPPVYPTFPLPADDEWEFSFICGDYNNLKKEKATRGTDYAAIGVFGVCDARLYLRYLRRAKLGVSASVHETNELIDRFDVARVLIETKANGPSVLHAIRALRGLAHEENLPRAFQYIRPWDVQGEDKEQRAKAYLYVIEDGQYYIQDPKENGEMLIYIAEHTRFPHGTRGDQVDITSMATAYFARHPNGD
jgi:phage terminase large subunit-like protein